MTSTTALVSFLVLLGPCIYGAWSDLAHMRLPNVLTLLVIALYLVIMPFLLPLDEFGIRIGVGLCALVLGFVLSVSGLIGAGDAKFGAAGILFVHPFDVTFFLQLLGMTALAGVTAHRLFRSIPALRRAGAGWQSWEETNNFPFGLSIAAALLFYQLLVMALT